MALRLCCLALCASVVLFVGSTDPSPPRDPSRQKVDVDSQITRHPPAELLTRHKTARQTPLTEPPRRPAPGNDVVTLDFQFHTAHIEQLLARGSLQIHHPEGGLLLLTLRDVRRQHGTRTIWVQSDGLPGVITQRGDSFIATIATSRATYNLSHRATDDPDTTRLIDQRQLDLRVIPSRPDYRHAPNGPAA